MNIFTLSYRGRLIKTLVVMKLTLLLITLACFKVSASVYAQSITLNEKNAPITKVFRQIERQSGYSFFYKNNLLQQTNPVSIHIEGGTLTEVLDRCFSNQPLIYEIVDNTIIVKAKEKTAFQKIKEVLGLPINIKGRITDTAGRALAGSVIRVKGTAIVAIANQYGDFELKGIDENAILIISYIGYITEETPIRNDGLYSLKQNISSLEMVSIVSTGYQSIPKERATGSFAQPNKQMYEARVATDVLSKLEGITSGLVFNTTGITGRNTPKLSIRGRSTIYANDDPLIVVDNFPYDGDLANINPNDVENVTVLKDAAAASIWGVQAGNGVIVITTKKGRNNTPLSIRVNSNITIGDKPNLSYNRNFLSASDYIGVEQYLFNQGFYDNDLSLNNPEDPYSTYAPISQVVSLLNQAREGTISQDDAENRINMLKSSDVRNDLSKYFYRKSVNQQYSLSLSGGTDKTTYYFSGGYDKNLLAQKGSQYDRITVNTQNTFRPVEPVQLSLGVNYVMSNNTIDNTLSAIRTGGRYLNSFPYTQLADSQGSPFITIKDYSTAFTQNAPEQGFLNWSFNPLEELRNGNNTSKNQSNDFRLNTGLQYNIFKGLNADIKYQYQKTMLSGNSLATVDSYYARNLINQYSVVDADGKVTGSNIPLGGILSQLASDQDAHHFRSQLDYNYSDKHSALTALAGYELTEVKGSGNSNLLYGYDPDLGISSPVDYVNGFTTNPGSGYATIPYGNLSSGTINRYRSYFGNAAYTLDGKYSLSASGRVDASNYFGVRANQKAVPLWSAGAKWDISREEFYKISWLPTLRLRASYGYQGNLDKSLSAFNTMFYIGNPADYTNAQYAVLANVGNPDLRWEKSRQINLGLEFEAMSGRISGVVETYFKKGIDLIGYSILAPSTGVTEMKGNYSGTAGRGIDVQLNTQNIRGNFSWSSSILFSRATDKVTLYTGTSLLPGYVVGDGRTISPVVAMPVYGVYSFKWAGLSPTTGDPQGLTNDGNISTDYAVLNNPLTMSEVTYHGPARPVVFGGFGNRFAFKNISLAFNISYKLGYYFRRSSLSYYSLFYQGTGNSEYSFRWQKPGDEANTNVPSMTYPSNQNRDYFYNYSEATIEKGDHVRLQDITLSYDLLRSNLPKLPVTSVQFYAYVNNAGILWRANKKGLDPDYPTSGWPAPRTISFGIKATL